MKTIQRVLATLAALALLVVITGGPVTASSCALKQSSGVMCDTECTGSLGCFDESTGTCCYDSENACGMEQDCEVCTGSGCTLGGF